MRIFSIQVLPYIIDFRKTNHLLMGAITILLLLLLNGQVFSQEVWDMVGKTKKEVRTSYGSKYEVNNNGAWTYYFNGPGVTLEFNSEDVVKRAVFIAPFNTDYDCKQWKKQLVTQAKKDGFKSQNANLLKNKTIEIKLSIEKVNGLFVLYADIH